MKSFQITVVVGLFLILGASWLLFNQKTTSSLSDAVKHDPDATSIIDLKAEKNNTSRDRKALTSTNATEPATKEESQLDSDADMDQDYIDFALDLETPVVDAMGGLIKLISQGNGDAVFALLSHAENCRSHPKEIEKYCPGTGLSEYGRTTSDRYSIVKDAASKGSLMAMTLLIDLPPPPFNNNSALTQNLLMRAQFADVVTEHYEAAREYLEFAAQKGFPAALRRSADLYAFSSIVDPDAEKAAFYILALHEITGLPIPTNLQYSVIDPLDTEKYNTILANAQWFVEQIQE